MAKNVHSFVITANNESTTCVKKVNQGEGVNLYSNTGNLIVTEFYYKYTGVNVGEFIPPKSSLIIIII